MKSIIYTSLLAVLLALAGCKTNNNVMKCPDVFASRGHHATWAKAPRFGEHNTASPKSTANVVAPIHQKSEPVASTSNEVSSYELKIPRIASGKMNEDELAGVNTVFEKYSTDKVHLERRANGKVYLKANSAKDVLKLAMTLATLKKTNPAALPPGDRGRIALAGGIIGIVAIVLSLGPFISYGAFLLGIIAIILGVVGLGSSRPGWAIAAIVLGVLAVLFAGVLGIGIYTIVLHI
jgi:hypothetical protein